MRSRHVFSIGIDLGLPTGVLAQFAIADALGNAHMLGTLLAPYGVVAIPPEIFGHLLPFFIQAAPGVIFNGDPPYSLWEHPPRLGRIPPHRTDAGCYLLAECFGCATMTLIKDVDGLYDRDPKEHPNARFIDEITVAELRERNLPTLPFDASCSTCWSTRGWSSASRSSTDSSRIAWRCASRRAGRDDRPQGRRGVISPPRGVRNDQPFGCS